MDIMIAGINKQLQNLESRLARLEDLHNNVTVKKEDKPLTLLKELRTYWPGIPDVWSQQIAKFTHDHYKGKFEEAIKSPGIKIVDDIRQSLFGEES